MPTKASDSGFDLDNLPLNKATVVIKFMGETAAVDYRPFAITSEAIKKLDAPDAPAEVFVEFLIDVVSDWDIKKGGKKVPLTVESMMPLPLVLLKAVYLGVLEDAGQGEA